MFWGFVLITHKSLRRKMSDHPWPRQPVAALADERNREAATLPALTAEHASVTARGRQIETEDVRHPRIQKRRSDTEAVSWAEKGEHEMLNLIFNAFGIMLTAATLYGAMNGQIIFPIGFACAAVSVALFANSVEAQV